MNALQKRFYSKIPQATQRHMPKVNFKVKTSENHEDEKKLQEYNIHLKLAGSAKIALKQDQVLVSSNSSHYFGFSLDL